MEGPGVGLGGKGPRPQGKWLPSFPCWARLTTFWTPCPRSSSEMTQIFSLYWGREGSSHPNPALSTSPARSPTSSPPSPLPAVAASYAAATQDPWLPSILLLGVGSGEGNPQSGPLSSPQPPSTQLPRSLLPPHPRVYSHFSGFLPSHFLCPQLLAFLRS